LLKYKKKPLQQNEVAFPILFDNLNPLVEESLQRYKLFFNYSIIILLINILFIYCKKNNFMKTTISTVEMAVLLDYTFKIMPLLDITSSEKLILLKIKYQCCFDDVKQFTHTNEFLSRNLGIHEKSVSRSISNLIKKGYLLSGKISNNRILDCTDKTL
jgi:hypothetical protein